MTDHTYDHKGPLEAFKSEDAKVPSHDALGSHLGRVCAILESLRDAAGRSESGRLLGILATDADKLLAVAIGFGVAEKTIPDRFREEDAS